MTWLILIFGLLTILGGVMFAGSGLLGDDQNQALAGAAIAGVGLLICIAGVVL